MRCTAHGGTVLGSCDAARFQEDHWVACGESVRCSSKPRTGWDRGSNVWKHRVGGEWAENGLSRGRVQRTQP